MQDPDGEKQSSCDQVSPHTFSEARDDVCQPRNQKNACKCPSHVVSLDVAYQ
jgi:hypothetical protein